MLEDELTKAQIRYQPINYEDHEAIKVITDFINKK